jgi:hypothetical protein
MAIPNNTISCPIPDNINPLSPNGFMFGISKLPTLKFFCQQVNLPGITLGAPEFGNPFNTAPIPGESLTYDQLTVQAIHNWIVALGFPQGYEQYTTFINDTDQIATSELAKNYSDATLQILGSSNTVVKTLEFYDMFPIAIDSLVFQATNQDVNYLIGNATFRYGYYKFL